MPPRVPSGSGGGGGAAQSGVLDHFTAHRYDGTATGLDEEVMRDEMRSQGSSTASYLVNNAAREPKRTRRLPRPRTRDKDSKRSKGGEEWASVAEPSSSVHPSAAMMLNNSSNSNQADKADVELSLDTDFANIEDIVDLSKRQGSLVGPMNERLSPEGLNPTRPPLSPRSISSSMNTTRDRSSSLVGADRRPIAHTAISEPVLSRPPGPRRLASGPVPKSSPSSELRGGAKILPPWTGSEVAVPTLRKITREEAQQYVALGARPAPALLPPHAVDPRPRPGSAGSEHRSRGGLSDSVTNPSSILDGPRKSSVASVQSVHSGISPTSSVLDVTMPKPLGTPMGDLAQRQSAGASGTWTSVSFADGSYRFPDSHDRPRADSLGPRKSSASSSNVTSSWMAPDSWAVQPKRARDHLRDEESGTDQSEGEETDGPSDRTQERTSVGNSTVTHGHASSMDVSGSTTGYERRGTQDSISTTTSVDGPVNNGIFATQQDAPAIEYLNTSDTSDAQTLNSVSSHQVTLPPTPSSAGSTATRHGVRAGAIGIGSAAAAAAGKLGLHRPHRIKQQSSRPNTAGSIGAGGGAGLASALGSRVTEDDASSTYRMPSPIVTKRPSTVGQSNAGVSDHERLDYNRACMPTSYLVASRLVSCVLPSRMARTRLYRLLLRPRHPRSERCCRAKLRPAWFTACL